MTTGLADHRRAILAHSGPQPGDVERGGRLLGNMDFTLRQLSYFVAVAECGTISEAAALMHVSQSALSSALTELERTLGVQLCVRRKARGITLTPSGVHILGQARAILHEASELLHAAGSSDEELVGPLVVGSYGTLAPTVLPSILSTYAIQHPRVSLDFSERMAGDLVNGLRSGELDIGVAYDHDIPPGFHRIVLYEAFAHVVLATDHPLADHDTVHLVDLADEPFILLDMPPSTSHTASIFLEAGLAPPVPRYRTSSFELTRSLVARGFGYSVLVQVTRNLKSYEGMPFVAKPIEPAPKPVRVILLWPEGIKLTPRGRALVEVAQSIDWHPGSTFPVETLSSMK